MHRSIKRVPFLCLLLVLILCAQCAPAESVALPASSGDYSPALAGQALALCSGQTAEETRESLESAGFSVLLQQNFDKAADDPAHTCAFTVARGQVEWAGQTHTMLAVVIRGTSGGEWYSNFDFAPSHSGDTAFAENFLFAAQDVFLSLNALLAQEDNPLVLVTGHSRGAACANLLGVLLNAAYDPASVFVYTFATPMTVRGDALASEYPNIFNLVNPCDAVTKVPLAAWGYGRAGQDIVLQNDAELAAQVDAAIASLSALAPDIPAYYTQRHSLTGPGLSDDGLTVFDAMLAFGSSLTNLSEQSAAPSSPAQLDVIAADSDFAPLAALIEKISDPSTDTGRTVLSQHMPQMYAQLVTQGE